MVIASLHNFYFLIAKRSADLEKIRELDRLRLEVETLNEFRAKVLESQAALQRDLKKVRKKMLQLYCADAKSFATI